MELVELEQALLWVVVAALKVIMELAAELWVAVELMAEEVLVMMQHLELQMLALAALCELFGPEQQEPSQITLIMYKTLIYKI